jgi:hypothetical protein
MCLTGAEIGLCTWAGAAIGRKHWKTVKFGCVVRRGWQTQTAVCSTTISAYSSHNAASCSVCALAPSVQVQGVKPTVSNGTADGLGQRCIAKQQLLTKVSSNGVIKHRLLL